MSAELDCHMLRSLAEMRTIVLTELKESGPDLKIVVDQSMQNHMKSTCKKCLDAFLIESLEYAGRLYVI